MSTTPPAPPAASAADSPQLTADQVAKKLRRTVIELADGKGPDGQPAKVPKPKRVAVDAAELLSFRDYGTHVVAVTRDGQKLSSLDA